MFSSIFKVIYILFILIQLEKNSIKSTYENELNTLKFNFQKLENEFKTKENDYHTCINKLQINLDKNNQQNLTKDNNPMIKNFTQIEFIFDDKDIENIKDAINICISNSDIPKMHIINDVSYMQISYNYI